LRKDDIDLEANQKKRRAEMGLTGAGKTLAKKKWREAGCFDDLSADLFTPNPSERGGTR
jgi:hypothetical protein